jgi:hypothetical protein
MVMSFVGADGRAKDVSPSNPLPVTGGTGGGGGGGGSGDASAANQVLQTAQLEAINADLGAPDAAAATTDDGTFGLIPLFKRLLGKLPTLSGGAMPVLATASPTDKIGSNTREYDWANAQRTAIASTTSAELALPALGASREVMFHASSRCFVRMGGSPVPNATVGPAQMVLEAGERFHIRIPAGTTHYRVIRDTADGFLSLAAVL